MQSDQCEALKQNHFLAPQALGDNSPLPYFPGANPIEQLNVSSPKPFTSV